MIFYCLLLGLIVHSFPYTSSRNATGNTGPLNGENDEDCGEVLILLGLNRIHVLFVLCIILIRLILHLTKTYMNILW